MPGADASGDPVSNPVRRVAVLLPLPLKAAYDYAVPDEVEVVPGSYVLVPLGPRQVPGVVWGEGAGDVDAGRLKPILRVFDLPPMPDPSRRFVDWVAAYTVTPPGQVLRMAISVPAALEADRPGVGYRLAASDRPASTVRITPAREKVLSLLASGGAMPAAAIRSATGSSAAVIRGLAEAGLIDPVPMAADPFVAPPDRARPGPSLSGDQEIAAMELRALLGSQGFAPVLLDGVTGSGKTEVYFEAIAACLEAGRQALVLLPEIALGAQWLARFADRFGAPPAQWHSELGSGPRRRTWRAVASGEARVVVGARSALFLPYPALGLIVVDEEHESAFKQEDGVLYHARDMAVARAWITKIPVVLASATPSLETLANTDSGKYRRLVLASRHGGARLPVVDLIDLREHPPERQCWLSPPLRAAMAQHLASGEQVMLFLNRRGYAPLTLCRACGHRFQCTQCSAWMVEHRLVRRLQCHHCGTVMPLPESCPQCGEEGTLAACGPGVERVAEEVAALFPDAPAALFTSDFLDGPAALREVIQKVTDREVQILIGTQVMAKGHHFPWLTLVGVVDADLGLGGGDLRAGERTFQLLHQVAGRAGRAERPGRVLLQSYMPEHPVMQALAAGDRDRFMELEAEERRALGWPPFGRLVALIVSGPEPTAVDRAAQDLARTAPRSAEVEVLGPAPAPLSLLRGRHRRRLLVKAPKGFPVQTMIADWLAQVPMASTVRVQVDVDPYSFL